MAIKSKPRGKLLVDIFSEELGEVGQPEKAATKGGVLVLVLSGDTAERVRRGAMNMGVSEADVIEMAVESYGVFGAIDCRNKNH